MTNRKYGVEITANTSQFEAALARASAAATASTAKMSGAFSKVSSRIEQSTSGLGAKLTAALGVAAVAGWSRAMISAANDLQDLSEETGSTVESLSRLANIAKLNGTEFDTFRSAMERLAAGMAGAEEGSSKTAEALRFLKVTASDPAQALEEIAKRLDDFADGAGKAAIAKDLFGKSGVAFLTTLKQIANSGEVAASVTREQAAEAKRLSEAYAIINIESSRVTNEIAGRLVPVIADMLEQFREGKRLAGGFWEALRLFGTTNPFVAPAQGIRELTQLIEDMQRRQTKGRAFDLFNELPGEIADAQKRLQFQKYLQRQDALRLIDESNNDARDFKARQKPALPYVSSKADAGKVDDTARRELDAYLRSIEATSRDERDILKDREAFLTRYYQDDQIGIREFFAQRQATIAEALRVETTAFDQEIAALEEYKAKASPRDRIAAETQIADVVGKRTRAQREAANASVNAFLDETKAASGLKDKADELAQRLAELSGDTVTAASLGFERAYREVKALAEANVDSNDAQIRSDAEVVLSRLAKMRTLSESQAQMNTLQERSSTILQQISNEQGMLDAQRASGALTELEYLDKVGAANAKRLDDLRAVAVEYERIGRAAGDPKALLAAEAVRVEIGKLAAATNLVAKQFEAIAEGAFADFLVDIVNGTKSVKAAFLDMEKQIVASITRIAAQNLAEKLFGGGGGPSSGNSWLDLLISLGMRFLGVNTGLGYGTIGSSIPSGPFPYANGTDFHPGGWALVGERGPELLNLPRGSKVTPNHELGRSSVINVTNHFAITGPVDTRTQRQIASAAAASIDAARMRG